MASEVVMKDAAEEAGTLLEAGDMTSDSSAQGAAMLIRLKEGVGYVYAVPQGHIAEMARDELTTLGANGQDPDAGDLVQMTDAGSGDAGQTARSNSVAVQANDYEIERRSGVVPARHRLIPFKFRDFHAVDDTGEDPGDADYEPEESSPSAKRVRRSVPRPGARSVGRPRKVRKDHAYDRAGQEAAGSGDGPDAPQTEEQGSGDEKTKKKASERPFPRRGRPPKDDPYSQPKVFKCLQCDKKFSLKGNLKVHMRTHTDERPFKCDLAECGKSFRSNESLRRHTMAHQGIKLFGCDICDKRFSSNVTLKEHIARHTDTKSQICPVCNRAFRQLSCLRRHMTTHTAEQPYPCKLCDKRFSQAVYLRSHMRSHTGERPWKCRVCTKAFAHQSDLTRHMTIHLGTKPYVCEVCEARFSDPSTRRRHVREHAGYKPYTCQLCGDTFKRSGQLKAHLNKKHMNYKDDVVISKAGRFNSLQFQFKGNPNTGVAEQLAAAGKVGTVGAPSEGQVVQAQVMQAPEGAVVGHPAAGQVVTIAPGQEHIQIIDENGQIQHLQVQHVDSNGHVAPTHVLGQIQQQLVEAGFSQSQLDGNQIILAQTNSGNQEELSEETQKIIQQIQSQLDPSGEAGVAYHILHDDDNQQIVEIQYHAGGNQQEALVALVEGQEGLAEGVAHPEGSREVQAVAADGQQDQQLVPPQAPHEYQQDVQQPEQEYEEVAQHQPPQYQQVPQPGQEHLEQALQPPQGHIEQALQQPHGHLEQVAQPPQEHKEHTLQTPQEHIEQALQTPQEHLEHALQPPQGHIEQALQPPQGHIEHTLQPLQEHIQHALQTPQEHLEQVAQPPQEHLEQVAHPPQGHLEQVAHPPEGHIAQAPQPPQRQPEQNNDPQETVYKVEVQEAVERPHGATVLTIEPQDLQDGQPQYEVQEVDEAVPEAPGSAAVGEGESGVEGENGAGAEEDSPGSDQEGSLQRVADSGEATLLTLQTLEQQQQQASVNYVANPDFNSQEYYNWLSSFTELCKLVPMPLDVDLFQKISQVHKTLSDVLATPRGILTNRENFRTLMNISRELNSIINEHLNFVLHNLDTDVDME